MYFLVLYNNAYKLLLDIARNKTCSEVSVKALKVIKFCAIVISAFVVAGILVVAIFIKGDRVELLAFECHRNLRFSQTLV